MQYMYTCMYTVHGYHLQCTIEGFEVHVHVHVNIIMLIHVHVHFEHVHVYTHVHVLISSLPPSLSSLFHLLHSIALEGEHPHTEHQLVLQLKCDPAIQQVYYTEKRRTRE